MKLIGANSCYSWITNERLRRYRTTLIVWATIFQLTCDTSIQQTNQFNIKKY
jgi:hypothetical protein